MSIDKEIENLERKIAAVKRYWDKLNGRQKEEIAKWLGQNAGIQFYESLLSQIRKGKGLTDNQWNRLKQNFKTSLSFPPE